jgi:hypothetical protein
MASLMLALGYGTFRFPDSEDFGEYRGREVAVSYDLTPKVDIREGSKDGPLPERGMIGFLQGLVDKSAEGERQFDFSFPNNPIFGKYAGERRTFFVRVSLEPRVNLGSFNGPELLGTPRKFVLDSL